MNKECSILWNADSNYMSYRESNTPFLSITASLNTSNLVHAAPVYQIQATLIELDWWGPPRPLLSPQGFWEYECVWVRKWEWELQCVLGGLRALASDWVFREQCGVQKARQWSNRISSLWWMVCESSTDSSLSQTHTIELVCVHVRLHTSTHRFKDFLSLKWELRMLEQAN